MCGFVGIFGGGTETSGWDNEVVIQRMSDAIIHRGPDDKGCWWDESQHIGLGHRRLSIVDLSPAGHQPMHSSSRRYVIVFNGEIYNHLALRKSLESSGQAPIWLGHSDTETLLAGFDAWGVQATVEHSIGMFAFAVWDRQDCVLTLARDRMGEKPLYYGWQKDFFLFGSELKAITAHPAFEGEIDRDVLTLLLRHSYIPAPYSIYKGIRKLPAGTLLRLDVGSLIQGSARKAAGGVPRHYWSLNDVAIAGVADPFKGDDAEAVAALERLLLDSVQQQMMADVPLGAFLSGGIDSSAIVALMQAQSDRPVKTFTIGFSESGYDEAKYAKEVARHLGTEHTELYVSPKNALEVIPRLPALYDEPFSDSSQIPTFLVSQATRKHVTVALSGDGGDELFGGYNRYFVATNLWRKFGWIPIPLRKAVGGGLGLVPASSWNSIGRLCGVAQGSEKARKIIEVLNAPNLEMAYRSLVSHWKQPSEIVIGSNEPRTLIADCSTWPGFDDVEHTMMYLDALSYLPDDVLVKVDRAAMGVSLETRVPLLDHRVVEFAWRLPLAMKIRQGEGKWILRQVLYKYVPKNLIDRPKVGFAVPIGDWLRGPLREWAEILLNESRLRQEGFFNPEPILQKWREHLSGRGSWQYHLWDVLMFQAWLEQERGM